MSKVNALDRIRKKVLDDVEQSQRRFTWAIALIAVLEGTGYLTYILLADWSNRIHVLIFVAALLVNVTVAVGLVVSGAYLNLCMQRALKAIEISDEEEEEDKRT